MLSWTHSYSIAAAIEVEPLFVEPFLIQVLYNPQCFLLYEDTALPPSQWKVYCKLNTHPALICPTLCAPPFVPRPFCPTFTACIAY